MRLPNKGILVISLFLLIIASPNAYVPENKVITLLLVNEGPFGLREEANETILVKNYANYTMTNITIEQRIHKDALKITNTPFGSLNATSMQIRNKTGIPNTITPPTIQVYSFYANTTYFNITVSKLEIGETLEFRVSFKYVLKDSEILTISAANVTWYDNWGDPQSQLTNTAEINFRTTTGEDPRVSYIQLPEFDKSLEKRFIYAMVSLVILLPILNFVYIRRKP